MSLNLDNLDEDTRNKIVNLQNMSQTMEFLTQQKLQMETAERENNIAIEELEKIEDATPVYKSIGGILVKSEKNKLLDEKKSLKTTLEMRIKTIDQKVQRTRSNLEAMQKSLQADLKTKGA